MSWLRQKAAETSTRRLIEAESAPPKLRSGSASRLRRWLQRTNPTLGIMDHAAGVERENRQNAVAAWGHRVLFANVSGVRPGGMWLPSARSTRPPLRGAAPAPRPSHSRWLATASGEGLGGPPNCEVGAVRDLIRAPPRTSSFLPVRGARIDPVLLRRRRDHAQAVAFERLLRRRSTRSSGRRRRVAANRQVGEPTLFHIADLGRRETYVHHTATATCALALGKAKKKEAHCEGRGPGGTGRGSRTTGGDFLAKGPRRPGRCRQIVRIRPPGACAHGVSRCVGGVTAAATSCCPTPAGSHRWRADRCRSASNWVCAESSGRRHAETRSAFLPVSRSVGRREKTPYIGRCSHSRPAIPPAASQFPRPARGARWLPQPATKRLGPPRHVAPMEMALRQRRICSCYTSCWLVSSTSLVREIRETRCSAQGSTRRGVAELLENPIGGHSSSP